MSVTLSQEQETAVAHLLRGVGRLPVQTLGGLAGTGKTTMISALKDRLPRGDNWAVCAFTGKAANVLRKKGLPATTIHSQIYQPIMDGDDLVGFELKPFADVDGFIVDEASMVGSDIFRDLQTFDRPLILVGDHGQIEPVGAGVNLMADPMIRLETIHRNAGEIAHFAQHLRQGKPARTFPAQDKVVLMSRADLDDQTLAAVDQVICAFNKSRVDINNRVRRYLGRKDLVEVGERVMCLKNSARSGLFNGMQGEVTRVLSHNRFDFKANDLEFRYVPYQPAQFGQEKYEFDPKRRIYGHPFDYAYAATAHKCQGDEFDSVLVLEQRCERWDHKRWTYTAASRARDLLVWVG